MPSVQPGVQTKPQPEVLLVVPVRLEQPEAAVPGPGIRKLLCTCELLGCVTAACLRHVLSPVWLLTLADALIMGTKCPFHKLLLGVKCYTSPQARRHLGELCILV